MALPTEGIGVLFAPFQIPSLRFGKQDHTSYIEQILTEHNQCVIALPVKRVAPTKNNPLPYETRVRMILERFPNVICVPVPDTKYPVNKIAALKNAVASAFSDLRGQALTFYIPMEWDDIYKAKDNFKNFKLHTLLSAERGIRTHVTTKPFTVFTATTPEEGVRIGMIAAMNQQFPITWGTIDMAILRTVASRRFVLLGKKPGENGWRFPGGFKDRTDPDYETAVYREGGEEVLQDGSVPKDNFSYPAYIGSREIKDWRYADEIDGITTMFFALDFVGDENVLKANDDLAEVQWFAVNQLTNEMMEGEHAHLLVMLRSWLGLDK